jgi:hypothetical protein
MASKSKHVPIAKTLANFPVRAVLSPSRFCLSSLLCLLAPFSLLVIAQTQDRSEETVRVRTRVVFIDTLVKDKKTGASVTDLTRENFEVLADGKPRTLSYFSRADQDQRRPLALVLVLDLVARDTSAYLRRAEVVESLAATLKRLPPGDEVAVMANLGGAGAPLRILTDFTRDPAKVAEALAVVPTLPVPEARWYGEELGNVLERVEQAAAERPNSQIILVPVTTVLGPIPFAQRNEIAARLIRANAYFSPLICDPSSANIRMSQLPGKYPTTPRPIFSALGRLAGTDMYAPQHIAEQTGGEAISVNQPQDYVAALERMIANLSARYSLGFALNQNEQDDGRMHKLEVRIKARDARGKERKLIVRARQGYYIPRVEQTPSR